MGHTMNAFTTFTILCLAASVAGFGSVATDDACACTGNQGKTATQAYYSQDFGNECAAWDADMDYCQCDADGLVDGQYCGADWCPLEWCYVDAACEGASKGSYLEDYDGPDLYYSYSACGASDEYT